jgi:hypothetical protein
MVCPTFIGFGIVALTPDKSRYRTCDQKHVFVGSKLTNFYRNNKRT